MKSPNLKTDHERTKHNISCNVMILEKICEINNLCISVLMHQERAKTLLNLKHTLGLYLHEGLCKIFIEMFSTLGFLTKPHGFVEKAFSGEKLCSFSPLSLSHSNKISLHLKFITWSPEGRIWEKIEGKGRRAEMLMASVLFVFS